MARKLLHIEETEFMLQEIVKYMQIDFEMSTLTNVLRIQLDEDRLLDIAGKIQALLPKEAKVDTVEIYIGDYKFKAQEDFERVEHIKSLGFKKI